MAALRIRAAIAVLVATTASGCMGYRSWGYEEDARIDAIIARGREPLEEAAAQGIPVPNVPRSAESLAQTRWQPIKQKKSKPVRVKSARAKAAKGPPSKPGFRFSGL